MHRQHVLPPHVVAVQRDRARRGRPPPPVPLPQRGPWHPALPREPELGPAECAWHSGSGHTAGPPSAGIARQLSCAAPKSRFKRLRLQREGKGEALKRAVRCPAWPCLQCCPLRLCCSSPCPDTPQARLLLRRPAPWDGLARQDGGTHGTGEPLVSPSMRGTKEVLIFC